MSINKLYNRKKSPPFVSDETNIPITINFSSAPTTCKNSIAILKYDKDFAYSFTFDDALISALTCGYSVLAGGTADNGVHYSPLYYTDGCGNNKLFKAASAFYAVNSLGIDLHNGTPTNLTYANLTTLYNAGWDIINHSWSHSNGSTNSPGRAALGHPDYPYEISQSFAALNTAGIPTWPHFIIPGGDMNYLPDVISAGIKCIYNQAGASFYGSGGFQLDGIELEKPFKLFRKSLESTDTYPTIKGLLESFASSCTNGKKGWYNDFTHTLTTTLFSGGITIADYASYMGFIASTYGATGSDNVWMAPLQEVWEYNNLKENTRLTVPNIVGSSASFSINHNVLTTNSRRFCWTIKITADQNISSVTVPSGYTSTFRGTGSNKIINIEKT